jgi:integrase
MDSNLAIRDAATKTIGHITTAHAKDYVRARLVVVKATTIVKELSAFRGLLSWSEEQRYVDSAPLVAKIGSRVTRNPHAQRRRGKATELTVEEARAIVNLLPNYSESKRVPRFVVRERFVVMYETALRPATLDTLSVPEHYTPGSPTLTITGENDKARYARELPLSAEARAALDAVCPESGLIFGDHDYRDQLRKAAEVVLDARRAATFTAYDLRHLRLTKLAEAGNIIGAAYLAGHKRPSTTDRYLRPSLRAGEHALRAVGATGFNPVVSNPVTRRNRLAVVPNQAEPESLCEGEDLNLHGSYPASTSIQARITEFGAGSSTGSATLLGAEFDTLLANEAQALLDAAANQQQVETERLRAFARACLELSETGRLALAVLDGGLCVAPRARTCRSRAS